MSQLAEAAVAGLRIHGLSETAVVDGSSRLVKYMCNALPACHMIACLMNRVCTPVQQHACTCMLQQCSSKHCTTKSALQRRYKCRSFCALGYSNYTLLSLALVMSNTQLHDMITCSCYEQPHKSNGHKHPGLLRRVGGVHLRLRPRYEGGGKLPCTHGEVACTCQTRDKHSSLFLYAVLKGS